MENNKVTFIVLSGIIFAIFIIAINFLLAYFRVHQLVLVWGITYLLELGYYCLVLYFYKLWVSRVLWFTKGFTTLIVITLIKSLVTSLLLFVILTLANRFAEPGISNLVGLLGVFARGFVFELALMGVAAKLFETDIFAKETPKDSHIIDNL